MQMRKRMSDKVTNTIFLVIVTMVLITVLYPVIFVVSSSFSSGQALASGRVILWPVELCLTGYKLVFAYKSIWTGYANTILYTFGGTLLNVIMTILVAYPFSRRDLQWRGFYILIFMIPLFVAGGLIPSYILASQLHLTNTRLYMIISGAVTMSNVILLRTSFQTGIPEELWESAKIDGSSYTKYLLKIVLPLSKATISVITLYGVVNHWNSYFTPMIYLRDQSKFPLQLVVQTILSVSSVDSAQIQDPALLAEILTSTEVMRYALIVVATLPMIIFYPFVQKFFEKGVMVGSVKG
jgi:multiple sugar transport system permease protein/putative aldouronate transport system permease protein